MTKKGDMQYTNAFMQELYRYRTLAPLGVPHKSNADTETDSYVIPKGIQVNFVAKEKCVTYDKCWCKLSLGKHL